MKHAMLALALALMTMPAALAQNSAPAAQTAAPAAQTLAPDAQTPPHFSDLAATQHHQPTQAEVNARETEVDGAAAVDARNKQEQRQVDQLYQQLLGRPAK
ncbi:MAG TPA: hypothetical protein VL993_05630 [Stellaceae bacterium]|nr:hypothetical protein [Stellaceae bacterium]